MICIPIMAKNTGEALEKIARANPVADMLEFRLDVMESFRVEDMVREAAKPVIVTYRSKREGGKGSADYETRTRYLMNGIEKGAGFVDVEYSMPLEFRRRFLEGQGPLGVIISTHLPDGTPSAKKLEDILRTLAATGADIVKIVTRARALEDNLHVLDLIPIAQKMGVKIIAFCMGPLGRMSRIASPLLGGHLTFASLEEGQESADGQMPVIQMRDILKALKG
jgi:3-dehydroquinate dehydratase type I